MELQTIPAALSALNDTEVLKDINSEPARAFCLVASLHFGRNWGAWANLCRDSEVAALQVVHLIDNANGFRRPAFRALAALEFFDWSAVERAIRDGSVEAWVREVVTNLIPAKGVCAHLKKIQASGGRVALLAEQVLAERFGSNLRDALTSASNSE